MRTGPIPDQYARLPWLIVAMTVAFLAIGLIADRSIEHYLVAAKSDLVAPIRGVLLNIGAAWLLVWLPLLGFSFWYTRRMKTEWARAQATQALAETAEANYRQLVEQAKDIIYRVDLNGYFTYINAAVTRFKGYTQEELIGQHFTTHIRPDAREAAKRFYLRQFARQTPTTYYEFPVMKKDGGEVWLGQNVDLLFEHGRVVGFQAVARDITERKRMKDLLVRSRDFYLSILEEFPALVWRSNTDAKCDYFNRTWLTFTGRTLEQERGDGWAQGVHPEDVDRCVTEYLTAFHARKSFTMEYRLRRHDGEYRHILDHGSPFNDLDGTFAGYIGSCLDITDRKQAVEALAVSEKRLRTILDAEPECVKITTEDSILLNMNPAGLAAIEADSLEQVVGKSVLPMITPAHRDTFAEFNRHVFRGTPGTLQYEIIGLKGRHRWMDTHAVPLRNEQNAIIGVLAITHDITERKQAEERLAKINECFLNFGVDPEANINSLTALCGELLDATCALYNCLDGSFLRSIGRWNTPPGLSSVDPAVGHICHDVIRESGDHPVAVHHLPETRYAQTDPTVLSYKLQTYFGMAVKCQHKAVGSLCALFQRDYVPSEADTKLLGILAAAVGVEEERRLAATHQKRLLEELAESRNRFEMFFRQTPSAISITTIKEGRFLDLNKQAERLTGYTREELIGRTTVEMNLYVDPSERPGLVRELKEKGMLNDLEREIRTKSGEIRTAVFSLVPILMGSEPCMLSIAHDITERKLAEQRLHERSRQQAIEAELGVLAVTIQDLPHLLATAAGLVSNALEVNYCEVMELIPNGTDLRLCASAGWRGDDIGQVRTLETGSPAHVALNSNKPVVRPLSKESLFGGPKWLHEHGAVTSISVNIPGKDGPWGVLGVYTTLPRPPSRDDVNFLQTVSSILATAIERMQAESVLRSANQSLRLLSRQLLQVQEDDRRAIARDLHDEIGQSLTAIKLNVERAQRTADPEARDHIMRDCAQITEHVLGQVRNLSLDLHPSILDDLGLAYALKWYTDRQAERAGLKVELTADPSLPRLPQDVEITCFRIAQEALTNVVRHARAGLATITLKQGVSSVELSIKDDGIGFAVDQLSAPANGRSSVGLASMQERAKLLGGTVKITSALHYGTTVVATLPLPVASPAGLTTEQAGHS